MNKICIFDLKKNCNDCGDCMICDLDKNKNCDNCGVCLEANVPDLKEVQIDEIVEEDIEVFETFEAEEGTNSDKNEEELERDYILIEEVDGLEDVLGNLKEGSNTENLGYVEQYPGLIVRRVNKPIIKRYDIN